MLDRLDRASWGGILITLGATFAASGLTFWFAWGFPEAHGFNQVVLGIVVHVLFGYIVVMSGIAIYRSNMAVDECLVAAKWCFGGLTLMASLVVWAAAPELLSGEVSLEFLNQLVVVGSVGAAAGVLIGLNRGQARQNERLVEEKDERRETLVFLLQLLRHDIRNDLTTISGYADLLDRDVESDTDRERIDHIQRKTDNIDELLRTARAVVETETGENEYEPLDIGAVLRDRLEEISASNPELTVETDIEPWLSVRANELIDELFRNLFENAVTHNTAAELTLRVSAAKVGETVEITIQDDGAGIPDDIRETVFEPGVRSHQSNGDGLGLYLVEKLVTSYDGTIEIAETDGRTTFIIRFPAAKAS